MTKKEFNEKWRNLTVQVNSQSDINIVELNKAGVIVGIYNLIERGPKNNEDVV